MHVYATAKTDVGRVRERNEDAFLLEDELLLYAVADGMGGHAGGARASGLTVETLARFVASRQKEIEAAPAPGDDDPSPPLARLLADAVREASATVYAAAEADKSLSGMGTTCTAVLLRPGWAYVAHVGDSRCYMQRGQRFLQVTEDHSLVNEQVRAGLLTPEDAAKSRLKNIITRSVGFEREVDVDTFLVPLEHGDQFLLCSDGLSNLVPGAELGEAMMAMQGEVLVDFLVNVALERGGDDNVTVLSLTVKQQAGASGAWPTATEAGPALEGPPPVPPAEAKAVAQQPPAPVPPPAPLLPPSGDLAEATQEALPQPAVPTPLPSARKKRRGKRL